MTLRVLLSLCLIFYPALVNSQSLLTSKLANQLAEMPISCLHREYPNKTSHTDESMKDAVLTPAQLHPSFYGCFDWHSSVHGHWMLVRLLKQYPELEKRQLIIEKLDVSFQPEKLKQEAAYFSKYELGSIFERTYGWAWLLKLDQELLEWDHPKAKEWHSNLAPLTQTIKTLWLQYLPKQTYPNRTGVHPNSAFGLSFALDWAVATHDTAFTRLLKEKTLYFYHNDVATPAYLEPDGTDFFSPSLQIAALMSKVLDQKAFTIWLTHFYNKRSIENLLTPPIISDHNDYQITHLNGLLFSRAWCMRQIAGRLPDTHDLKHIFHSQADVFIKQGLTNLDLGNYGGDHWLASFAVYALSR